MHRFKSYFLHKIFDLKYNPNIKVNNRRTVYGSICIFSLKLLHVIISISKQIV